MKTKTVQNNFLSGVLDPRASARVETDAYNNGLLTGRNIELHHLGGVRRRRGLAVRATIINQLTRIVSATATAPNGGTAANAKDDNTATLVTTTTPVGVTNEFVVVHYDLGSARAIVFADVLGISTASGSSTEFCIQSSTDNIIWDNTSPSFANSKFDLIDTVARDYRRPTTATARYWRVVRIGVTNLPANITLADFNLWEESASVSEGRAFSFEVSNTDRFLLVVTDRSGIVFQDSVALGYIPLPYVNADVPELDADASDGEMLLTHEDYPTRALFEDTSNNFQTIEAEFSNIPKIDFDDALSPIPTSEIQVITLAGGPAIGNTFQVSLDGARSGAVAFAGDATADQQTATAANFAREIQKLWVVPGSTGVACTRTGALTYTVTFANASAKTYGLMVVTALAGTGTTSVARTQAGVPRMENLWSTTRGYPGSVAFFEKRIYFGGTRSKQSSLIGSHVIDTFNFDLAEGLDDEAIFVTLTGPQTAVIQRLMAGDMMQVFASGGEFRYLKRDGEPVTPADVPKNQTNYGSRRVRPVLCDGTTIYAHYTGKSLRDFKYDVNVDKYTSLSLTSLAPHLLNDVVDMAAWNGSQADELNYVWAINGDGTAALLCLRQEVELKALLEWTTQGLFKAAAVVREDIYFLIQRTINGVDRLFLEQLEYDYYTDCAIKVTNSPADDIVVGLQHLNGQESRVRADGYVLSNATPSSGQITLDGDYAEVEVGLNFNPTVTPMPLATMTPTGSNFMSKRRIVKVRAKVRNTLGLLVNGRPLPDRYFDIDSFDAPATPYTGVHPIEESTNWDENEEKLVVFTQVDPLPMEILGIEVEMESG